jgi:hypothetical protein
VHRDQIAIRGDVLDGGDQPWRRVFEAVKQRELASPAISGARVVLNHILREQPTCQVGVPVVQDFGVDRQYQGLVLLFQCRLLGRLFDGRSHKRRRCPGDEECANNGNPPQ